ncbi:AAA family ATPase [Mesorhizobium sp. AR02]|uniref:AAA family ATPase n=1 Tax=Mesorhizobium sp. AR02 TaxID=2865837 RepID=UPI00215DF9B3|nr:AAA family ATPase [Mesorhizobium sp. AR02]UVK50964.1 AAA family ATPase [Mesorhizobium sp. AR02]
MTYQLTELVVTNFRSIKGTLTIPLDAPIVLVHGPNGVGKTSIATAIELALTGDVGGLRRSDENVQNHLVNRDALEASIVLRMTGGPKSETNISVRDGVVRGTPILDEDSRIFFTDRCYLSQSTLGRLLDIYQAPTSRDPSNTPLTSFVKKLLGLDQLEALIDGVYPAGHKARMSKLSADFDRADQLEGRLQGEQRELDALERSQNAEAARLNAELEQLRKALDLPEDLSAAVAMLAKGEDPELVARHEARVSGVMSLQFQWSSYTSKEAQEDRASLENEEADAARALENYSAGPGRRLATSIASIRPIFPDSADPERTDPEEARIGAIRLVDREIARVDGLLSSAAAASRSISARDQSINQQQARLQLLNGQIADIAGDSAGLGQALAALLPHVTDDVCPVCDRDFNEVSDISLRTHLSQEVARLIGQSEKLNSLVAERQQVQTQLAEFERSRSTESARVITPVDATTYQERLATLRTAKGELEALAAETLEGTRIRNRHSTAASKVAQLRLRDSTSLEIRNSLSTLAETIAEPPIAEAETTQNALSRLISATETALKAAIAQHTDRKAAANTLARLLALAAEKAERDAQTAVRTQRLAQLTAAQRGVKRERDLANNLGRAASEARSAIVGRVFNERLNAIWRDLFVRLAPNEPFVPAFVLPSSGAKIVNAILETVHRDGGSYGRPGAMLSAGNLNTAALTLFLALHLSVKPELPWLLLDDPVQSMDELHVAQFAALLRTLAKSEKRQLIIAVHERPLFEYLSLELSPAFVGDKLITVELSKSTEGSTLYRTNVVGFEPDRLVA